MKKTKRIATVLLALVMVLSLSVCAFADSGKNANNGEITINNAVVGYDYTIYQILALESYNTESGAYAYKATADWESFVNSDAIKGVYLNVDAQGYVTWVKDARESDFAALAKVHAKTLGSNQGSVTATSATVKFSNLNLGYYLVDSSLGALCSLDTTNPTVTIMEKNGKPTIDKQVQEDSTGAWGDKNDASIGDTVNFKATIRVIDGQPKNYVMHDTMSAGLTFQPNSVKVTVNGTASTNYTLIYPATDGHTFDISFSDVKPNDVIVVEYSAILNNEAVIYPNANTNKVKLTYTDTNNVQKATEEDKTDTYTFMFDIIKTDSSLKVLNGAKFELYDAAVNGNKIALVKESEGVYRVATAAEKNADNFTSAVIEAGKVTVKGLDSGTYYLEEIEAPDGYNKLAGRVEVKIEGANLTTTMTGDTWADGDGGVQITNNTGAELPSTGGIGTTIFYVVGGILVVGAAVVLTTRKRMEKNAK
ncbi:MAG: SpaH/EbpB family LPXTG-anchored major pilin [Firmicutes bacterium]|nr:SpaH/EbpB family LPXTG-anchored major pilin [Bacillota bacterium]